MHPGINNTLNARTQRCANVSIQRPSLGRRLMNIKTTLYACCGDTRILEIHPIYDPVFLQKLGFC